jgi:hypothetical protein
MAGRYLSFQYPVRKQDDCTESCPKMYANTSFSFSTFRGELRVLCLTRQECCSKGQEPMATYPQLSG